MVALANRIKETTSTTGTGSYSLGGAATGFQTFSVLGDGAVTFYAITDGTDWEVGTGTLDTGAGTLSRDTIHESSNSGNAVNWSSGDKDIFVDIPAQFFQTYEAKVSDVSSTTMSGQTTLLWSVEEYDEGGMVDLGSNNDRITFPVEGTYIITASYFTSESSSFNLLRFNFYDSGDNGLDEGHWGIKHSNQPGIDPFSITTVFRANAGDYATASLKSNSDITPSDASMTAVLVSRPLTVNDIPAHAASATLATETDPADITDVALSVASSDYDPYGMVDTANDKLIAPVSGFYEIGIRLEVAIGSGDTATWVRGSYRLNGGSWENIIYQLDQGDNIFRYWATGIEKLELSADDEIEFAVNINYPAGSSTASVDGKIWLQRIAKPIETGSIITQWADFTPTGSAWINGNVSTSGKWRRVGLDMIEAHYAIDLTGPPGNATLTLDGPPGVTVDRTVWESTAQRVTMLTSYLDDAGTQTYVCEGLLNSSNEILVRPIEVSGSHVVISNNSVDQTTPFTWASGDSIRLAVQLPVQP